MRAAGEDHLIIRSRSAPGMLQNNMQRHYKIPCRLCESGSISSHDKHPPKSQKINKKQHKSLYFPWARASSIVGNFFFDEFSFFFEQSEGGKSCLQGTARANSSCQVSCPGLF
jgi:hypothetical protein